MIYKILSDLYVADNGIIVYTYGICINAMPCNSSDSTNQSIETCNTSSNATICIILNIQDKYSNCFLVEKRNYIRRRKKFILRAQWINTAALTDYPFFLNLNLYFWRKMQTIMWFTNKRFLSFNIAFCTEKMYFDALYFLCRILVLSPLPFTY